MGRRDLCRAIHPQRRGNVRSCRPERGQVILTKCDDGYPKRFENLHRFWQVQNSLCAGSNNCDRRLGQLVQVSGNIKTVLGAAVHTADTARCKNADTGQARTDHSGRNSCSACSTCCDARRHICAAQLGDVFCLTKRIELITIQTDMKRAIHHCDCCWHRTVLEHGILHTAGDLNVLRKGHAMGNDGAFKSNDRLAGFAGSRNFIGKDHRNSHLYAPPAGIFLNKRNYSPET